MALKVRAGWSSEIYVYVCVLRNHCIVSEGRSTQSRIVICVGLSAIYNSGSVDSEKLTSIYNTNIGKLI